MLIERARMRNNYARPWGISIPLQLNDGKADDDSSEDSIDSTESLTIKDYKSNALKDHKKKMINTNQSKGGVKDFNDSDSDGDDNNGDSGEVKLHIL